MEYATKDHQNQPTRIVITGMGALTPLGLNIPDTWDALLAGKSGIDYVERNETTEPGAYYAGELKGFDARNYMDRKEARRLDEYIQFALIAADEAIQDAGLDPAAEEPGRVGVLLSSAVGGLKTIIQGQRDFETRGPRRVSPFMIPNMLVDSAAGHIAIKYGFHGPNYTVTAACATGTAACGEAFEMLRRGDADTVVVGGAEAALLPVIFSGFELMGALSTNSANPAESCRPFAADRNGFVMSEGAAVLVMETLEHALARDARIYAEVIGYGNCADAYHMAAPHEEGRGAADTMRMALGKAAEYGVALQDVDYINAHGTATQLNDLAETLAIKRVFGERAYNIPISSTKSMTGHMLAGAGAIEAIICAKVIENQVIPPTINLHTPDPECDLDYTPLAAREADVSVTLSNSFGFGGHNACLMLRRFATNGQSA
ncbi:MAG: beta-ketoacyl-ACP synthase II [Caldilineaceae bacterium]|nr:beta-ketoacyl-ACP synthase II [Caldilineaceae bacterium]